MRHSAPSARGGSAVTVATPYLHFGANMGFTHLLDYLHLLPKWGIKVLPQTVLGGFFAVKTGVVSAYQVKRLQSFVDPAADPQMSGYQLRQSRITIGSGGFIVMDEDTSVVKNLWNFTRFYHHESCGQCSPCREGTGWMEKILWNIENGKGKMSDIDLLWDIQRKIEGNTICPLGDAAAWPVAAAIRHFRDEFEWHVKNPELCQRSNYGLAHYADELQTV